MVTGDVLVPLNTIISALIGAATFMVSIILSGTFGDYLEAERIPWHLATSCRAFYAEARVMMRTVDADLSAPLSARSRPRSLSA